MLLWILSSGRNKGMHIQHEPCQFIAMGLVRLRHSSHEIATQPSHFVDRAGWQAKMASVDFWILLRNAHRPHRVQSVDKFIDFIDRVDCSVCYSTFALVLVPGLVSHINVRWCVLKSVFESKVFIQVSRRWLKTPRDMDKDRKNGSGGAWQVCKRRETKENPKRNFRSGRVERKHKKILKALNSIFSNFALSSISPFLSSSGCTIL